MFYLAMVIYDDHDDAKAETTRKAWDPMELPPGPITRGRSKRFKEALQGLVLRILEGESSMDARKDEMRAYSNIIHVQDELEMIKTHHGIQKTHRSAEEKFWSSMARPSGQVGSPQRATYKGRPKNSRKSRPSEQVHPPQRAVPKLIRSLLALAAEFNRPSE